MFFLLFFPDPDNQGNCGIIRAFIFWFFKTRKHSHIDKQARSYFKYFHPFFSFLIFFLNFFSLTCSPTQKFSEFYSQKIFTRWFLLLKRLFRFDINAKLIDLSAQITSFSYNSILKFQIFWNMKENVTNLQHLRNEWTNDYELSSYTKNNHTTFFRTTNTRDCSTPIHSHAQMLMSTSRIQGNVVD